MGRGSLVRPLKFQAKDLRPYKGCKDYFELLIYYYVSTNALFISCFSIKRYSVTLEIPSCLAA